MDRLVKIPDTLTGPCMLMKNRDKNVNLSWCKTRFNLCFRSFTAKFHQSYTCQYPKIKLKTLSIATKPLIYCESVVNHKLFMFHSILSSSYTYHTRKSSLITLFENSMSFCPLTFKRYFFSRQTNCPIEFYVTENFTREDKRKLYKSPEGKWYHRKRKRKLIIQQISLTAYLRRESYRFVRLKTAQLTKFIFYFIPYRISRFRRNHDYNQLFIHVRNSSVLHDYILIHFDRLPRNVAKLFYYFPFKEDMFKFNLFRSSIFTYCHNLTNNVHI